MTPAEVLIQQRLTYEALSASTWSQAPPSAVSATTEEGSEVTSTAGEVKTKGKKRLSIREMVSLLFVCLYVCIFLFVYSCHFFRIQM